MGEQSKVVFRNVGQLYFPQTRVECHYSLTSNHHWSNKDWIGLFKVGWSSVKEYYTYIWALAPEDYTEGTNVNFCAHFQASYLPRPGEEVYQFVYVDEKGEVCAHSRHFTFHAPKPLEELETMKEERGEEDEEEGEGEDLLLVIPRAQLLQSRLEECLKEQADVKQALETVERERERVRENNEEARREWEREKGAMREEISELRENLRHSWEKVKRFEGKQKDVQYTQESLSSELSNLLAERTDGQQRIKELEDDITVLTDRGKEADAELERMKERVKKISAQMKHEEEKRKNLQEENEAALAEVRGLQERLEASEQAAGSLRWELGELGNQQSHTHAELHQARLQAARLTVQLSDDNLALREGRASWAQEREAYKQAAEIDKNKLQRLICEVQRKEEWLQEERMEREKLEVELGRERDCNRVLLCDNRREVQELKASLRKAHKEREQQRLEKQDLLDYICQLEQKQGVVSNTKSSEETPYSITEDSSSEEDKPASPVPSRPSPSALILSSHLEWPRRVEMTTQTSSIHSKGDTPVSDTQDLKGRCLEPRGGEDKPLNLQDHTDPLLSELAGSPMW